MKRTQRIPRGWLVGALIATLCAVSLTEFTIRLELVPLLMLLPVLVWCVIATAVVAVTFTCILLCRRKLRFTTRSVLLLVLVAALISARFTNEITYERRRASAQQVSVEQLLAMKPTLISFTGRYMDGRKDYPIQSWLGGIVTRLVDPNIMPYENCYVNHVDLSGSTVDNADMPTLVGLGSIQILDLSRTDVTDEGLVCLNKLAWIGEVRLNGTPVSDEALVRLRERFPNIRVVK